jgi:very-short-patch-repair endonuclease
MSNLEDLFLLQLRAAKLPMPEREYVFAKPRRWRADFAWVLDRLLVEIEGGTWINGRHQRGKGFEEDMRKYNTAALLGFHVLRFSGTMVKNGEALTTVEQALKG